MCNGDTIAKCGPQIIHHWAHKSLKHCDTWWENETEWHRLWKAEFPKEWQEVVHFNSYDGEKHIADVKTAKGLVIEFQNSPMSLGEMRAREDFYQNMVWIVNAKPFQSNFLFLGRLPNPEIDFFKDIVIHNFNKEGSGSFHRRSERIHKSSMVQIYNIKEIKTEIDNNYVGHHHFNWKRPRSVWFEAKKDVFLDFGDENLWKLLLYYPENRTYCIKKISKDYFINRANT